MHRLNGLSRVYLQGHGDWQAQKIGSWGPDEVADLLAACGMPAVRVVSIDGCELGRDLGTANTARISNSVNSFASRFHKRLGDEHGIRTEVYARVRCVFTGQPTGALVNRPEVWGRKYTLDDNDQPVGVYVQGHHRSNSKIRLYWAGGQQQRSVMP